MKTIFFYATLGLALLWVSQLNAATDYYLKLDGVKGETSTQSTAPSRSTAQTGTVEATITTTPQENSGVEPDEIDVSVTGDSDTNPQGGKVEMEWKVEEGEKAEGSGEKGGTEDINIGVGELENATNFGVLLGGSSDDDTEENLTELELLLLTEMQADSVPAEQISLNFEKIKTKVRDEVKLFGLLPITTRATVEIDAEQKVKVKFPWWAFLASGKNKNELGDQVLTSLSNILKTKVSASAQAGDDAASSLQGSMGF